MNSPNIRPELTQAMLNRFKNVVNNVMGGVSALPLRELGSRASINETEEHWCMVEDADTSDACPVKYPYSRPDFLHLNTDEVQVSADHVSRPILVPRDISHIPWCAGYAEVINAGKSRFNEDQARADDFFIHKHYGNPIDTPSEPEHPSTHPSTTLSPGPMLDGTHIGKENNTGEEETCSPHDSGSSSASPSLPEHPLPFTYFAVFDGHAGTGAALMAVQTLHYIIQEKITSVRDLILKQLLIREAKLSGRSDQGPLSAGSQSGSVPTFNFFSDKTNQIEVDSLVTGAIESAFLKMDSIIQQERKHFKISGGCTALVALFFLGKLYVANAGDSRAIIVRNGEAFPMSNDFTPDTERQRLQFMGYMNPDLLQNDFSHLQFAKRVSKKDVGKKVLCKNATMNGWTLKTVTENDLKYPMVNGEGKRARLLATIGVTRGFGDHDLRVGDSNIYIKPFLSAVPEVKVYDMNSHTHSENDVLIMGSDGLWDVTTNEQAAKITVDCLQQLDPTQKSRYTSAAQDLVMNARGLLNKGWRTVDDRAASADDITTFVIPLSFYNQALSQTSSLDCSGDTS